MDGDKANWTPAVGQWKNEPMPVGSYAPNAWGFYDMHGNVAEWCQDLYGEDYYASSPSDDPQGPASSNYIIFLGDSRVLRGGGWWDYSWRCRSASRRDYRSASCYQHFGFRLCCSAMP